MWLQCGLTAIKQLQHIPIWCDFNVDWRPCNNFTIYQSNISLLWTYRRPVISEPGSSHAGEGSEAPWVEQVDAECILHQTWAPLDLVMQRAEVWWVAVACKYNVHNCHDSGRKVTQSSGWHSNLDCEVVGLNWGTIFATPPTSAPSPIFNFKICGWQTKCLALQIRQRRKVQCGPKPLML